VEGTLIMKFWSEEHRKNYYNKAAREAFDRACDEGTDPDEIVAAARAYSIEMSSSGQTPLPFEQFLQSKLWEHRRN
jgi:hypothetical protein